MVSSLRFPFKSTTTIATTTKKLDDKAGSCRRHLPEREQHELIPLTPRSPFGSLHAVQDKTDSAREIR